MLTRWLKSEVWKKICKIHGADNCILGWSKSEYSTLFENYVKAIHLCNTANILIIVDMLNFMLYRPTHRKLQPCWNQYVFVLLIIPWQRVGYVMYWQVDFNSTFAVKLINVQDRRAVAADTCELIVNAPGENARWKRYPKKCMYTPLSLLAAATGVKLMNVLYNHATRYSGHFHPQHTALVMTTLRIVNDI